ncbi:MAG: hypothetical protein HKM95_07975 [Inquilinus sp.]|nr:hypothetical protein [Inquilinus sp.]
MNQTTLHPAAASARKRIAAAMANKPFMAALQDRDHRGHKKAVERWSRLHEAAFPQPGPSTSEQSMGPRAEDRGWAARDAFRRSGRSDGFDAEAADRKPARQPRTALQSTDRPAQGGPNAAVGHGVGTGDRPVINMEVDRIEAILDDAPALFEISDNPRADPQAKFNESAHDGLSAVAHYGHFIDREAARQGVDADLVRAIIYVENSRWNQLERLGDRLGRTRSILPMNIRPEPWERLSSDPIDFVDPAQNIRAGVTLLHRIIDRVDDPNPSNVASIWNFTGRELVSDFGARVEAVYDSRPWSSPGPARSYYRRAFSGP